MSFRGKEARTTRQRNINTARTVIVILGILALLLGLSTSEFRIQLIIFGVSLVVIGLFIAPLLSRYNNIAIIMLNSVILLLLLEMASTAILATVKSHFVRSMLEYVMDRPNQIVDHYLALPFYSENSWSSSYWQEHLHALRKEYLPYVIWRTPSHSGEFLNVDQSGIRKTPGAECSSDSFKIYVFGGSSVWGWGSPDWGTIPAYLQDKLSRQRKHSICVVNYGENAYVSTQNLIQLIMLIEKDELADLVIFYDGVNEVLAADQNGEPCVHQNFSSIAALFGEPGHPFITWAKNLNINKLIQVISRQFGLFRETQQKQTYVGHTGLADAVVRCYMNNYRIVGALAEVYGFEYYFILQPYILTGEKPLAVEERNMITGLNWVFDLNPAVKSLFTEIYEQVDSLEPQHQNLVSLSDVFDDVEEQVWIDTWGHITPAGNEKVAEAIIKVIEQK